MGGTFKMLATFFRKLFSRFWWPPTTIPIEYEWISITPPTFIYEPTIDPGGHYRVRPFSVNGEFGLLEVPHADFSGGGGGGAPSSHTSWAFQIEGVIDITDPDPTGTMWYTFSRFVDGNGAARFHRVNKPPQTTFEGTGAANGVPATSSAGSDYVTGKMKGNLRVLLDVVDSGDPDGPPAFMAGWYQVHNSNNEFQYDLFMQQPF